MRTYSARAVSKFVQSIFFAGVLATAGCPKQSSDANDAPRLVPDAGAPASVTSTERSMLIERTSVGDARLDCANAAKEREFLATHKSCTVDQDCTLVDTWLYPCGMPIQKSAIRDLQAVDHSVSTACTKLGFSAPERECSGAVLRSACSRGSCGNVVPFPLPEGR